MCWGRDGFGQLGEGVTSGFRTTPVTVVGGPFKQISANRLTTCALNLSDDAYCWGNNQQGELGNPAFSSSNVPVPVSTTLKFKNIAAGWIHTCGVQVGAPAGAAHCWGAWPFVGAGTLPDNQPIPIAVSGGLNFSRLFAGSQHTCGLTVAGAAYCWGRNSRGELGDGSTTDRLVPTPVTGGLTFVMLAPSVRLGVIAVGDHTCGITSTGAAYCWGANDLGQLGDGTTVNRLVPTAVTTSQVFVAIGSGGEFACGMTAARKVFCWGSNAFGELGSGVAGGMSTVPVAVPAPFN
jgi:alpha-tubulin suppressor-like RCC1 family protein